MKAQAQVHKDWLLVEEDECWFSRFAQPAVHAWAPPDASLKLVQHTPKPGEQDKALACFGALRYDSQQVALYFSQGQPNSEQMWVFIIGLLAIARQIAIGIEAGVLNSRKAMRWRLLSRSISIRA